MHRLLSLLLLVLIVTPEALIIREFYVASFIGWFVFAFSTFSFSIIGSFGRGESLGTVWIVLELKQKDGHAVISYPPTNWAASPYNICDTNHDARTIQIS